MLGMVSIPRVIPASLLVLWALTLFPLFGIIQADAEYYVGANN